MSGTIALLPLARGDADTLRAALSRMSAGTGHTRENLEALVKRLEGGLIRGEELTVLRRLVDMEHTLRTLIIRQHAPEPAPDTNAASLETLDALDAKLDASRLWY